METLNMVKDHFENIRNQIWQRLSTGAFLGNYESCTNWCLMHFLLLVNYG